MARMKQVHFEKIQAKLALRLRTLGLRQGHDHTKPRPPRP